ncbi:MAG: aldehyde ferredoxin oxidoreductase family protein [Desulfobacterales bacterium]|nr:MAG: aldehyde ferredoxin oxidoreductase family protein [Desulfobacterales bacterium]
MFGWNGKLLRVDLNRGRTTLEEIQESKARDYLGGRGLAISYLMEEMDPKIDPLSPQNRLVMASGPLTATPVPTGCRYMVVTKSPLTNALTCSNSGGKFPAALKKTGFDIVIVEGRAEKPVYLWIKDGQAEIRPAEHIWGMRVPQADEAIKAETSENAKVAVIGPAGERKVRISSIMNDKHRAAGRGGAGAVMGSKNLKAVAVKGSGLVPLADEKTVKDISRQVRDKVKTAAKAGELVLRDYGTAYMPPVTSAAGICPTCNFQTGVFKGAEKVSGQVLTQKYLLRPGACWGCPIACGRITRLVHPTWQGEGEGPEYETIASLGSSCGIDNLEAIIKANYLCNELGLDTISTGMTIGCAMELFERGLLPPSDIDRPLSFGDADAMVNLVEKTAFRDGFGDLIAEGSYRLAEHCGHPEYSMSAKKMEFPGYDPRGAKGMGILYATSNIGASHMKGDMIYIEFGYFDYSLDPLTPEGKAKYCKIMQDIYAVIDSVGVCAFAGMRYFIKHDRSLALDPMSSIMRAATGIEYTPDNLLKAGERIYNLERLFLIEAGFTHFDDTLPPRMLKEPMPEGPATGHVVELDRMLDEYYQHRGWDRNGRPTHETLDRLGLKRG